MAQPVRPRIDTASVSSVASNAVTPQTIAAANSARTNLIVHNDSTAILYLKFGATAAANDHTTQVASQGTFTMSVTNSIYSGVVTGLWASANGSARVTEY